MSLERGDVVIASDPFKPDNEAGRPFLLISRAETPFHGEQYIALSLTTRTWHDDRIDLSADDWSEGGAPESSAIMPWSEYSVNNNWIDYRQGTLRSELIERAITELISYFE